LRGTALRGIADGRRGHVRSAVRLSHDAHELPERYPETPVTPSTVQLFSLLAEQHLEPDWDAIATRVWHLATVSSPAPHHVLSFASLTGLAHALTGLANCALGIAAEAIAVLDDVDLARQVAPVAERLLSDGAGDYYMTQRDLITARRRRPGFCVAKHDDAVGQGPGQLRAPPRPWMRSRMWSGGCSMICEKRTTVTVSSIDTLRP